MQKSIFIYNIEHFILFNLDMFLTYLKQVRLLAFESESKQTSLKRTLFNDNTIYNISIKLSFSSLGQNKSKLQKQINM